MIRHTFYNGWVETSHGTFKTGKDSIEKSGRHRSGIPDPDTLSDPKPGCLTVVSEGRTEGEGDGHLR